MEYDEELRFVLLETRQHCSSHLADSTGNVMSTDTTHWQTTAAACLTMEYAVDNQDFGAGGGRERTKHRVDLTLPLAFSTKR